MRLLKFLSDTFARSRAERREAEAKAAADRKAKKELRELRRSRVRLQPIRVVRAQRNAKCPCGSGSKFKHCCKELQPIEYLPPKQDKRANNAK